MTLPPILFHYFQTPLPYARTLALQEKLHALQLSTRRTSPGSHPDLLLLLQHRPVYTFGRRQSQPSIGTEEDENDREHARLKALGADSVCTARGGLVTYHGPGQLVGYPLFDLSRPSPSHPTPIPIRTYISLLIRTITHHLQHTHSLVTAPCAHTGVFLDEHTKVASVGVQVRHRLTTHGFSLNVTKEPIEWFDRVVACGLEGVRAGCIEEAVQRISAGIEGAQSKPSQLTVPSIIPSLVSTFGNVFNREMRALDMDTEGEVQDAVRELEKDAKMAGDWLRAPLEVGDLRSEPS
ncbi:hypothetical protein SERLA73DRAFT_165738 [Serpula lacrymans var. lacrymans S7.3]|uniref:lipoyl(octanoyl) transferase n=2 Tax=Serpula lacrymans var. lacrymans TaxID=341189 RepID=F8PMG0_SERL3|nr:uncharacterized protein SERLADRAFT_413374 [Serpula lacrymans var. lacrymans S7.9]EGO02792.1 hypothetical protein SERLA73DRAFT_165738 [Serpula lacrymans var. lacrymans S7.3]EGO28491.1 hypothetical protein SERLADRAFT_413374 [Serpula lacrymans var. lacrymans S7.9]